MEKQMTVIDIPQGKLEGSDLKGCVQFLNVPYASDGGRFKKAQRVRRWEGVRNAAEPGPVFPQTTGRLSFVMGNTKEEKKQSESAFSVNIWTPDTRGAYPVLFWMHGGAFMTGGGAIPWYSGEAFAREMGIVVVSVSYRLGVLGNLYLPEIADTNLSVHDVNQALIWVHDNIRYFGGDPDNITIAGQSAGAWYAVVMMGNPALNGLYRRAGLFSFNGGTAPYLKAEAAAMTDILLRKLGIGDPKELCSLSVQDILAAQKIAVNQPERLNIPFLPVIDDRTIFPDYIRQAALNADPSVEIFCGTVSHESTPFVACLEGESEEQYLARVRKNTEIAFVNDTELLLRYLGNAGHDIYRYEFAYESAMPHVHACHCFDIPFLLRNFDKWEEAPFLQNIDPGECRRVSDAYSSDFASFMRTGRPNDGWEKYDGTNNSMRFYQSLRRIPPSRQAAG